MNSNTDPEPQFAECPALFSEVLSAITTGIVILDVEKQEVFFQNPHAVAILERVGVDYSYPGMHALVESELNALLPGSAERSPRKEIRLGDRMFGYTLYGPAADGRFVAVFLQDITDQSRLESIDEAAEMMHNIGFLFSGIRHEIGNPINSMKMALTVLRKNVHRFPVQELEKYFDRIFDQVAKMEVLLKSLKTFNLFEQPRPTLVDMGTFLSEFMQLLAEDVRKKHIAMDMNFPKEELWVNVDVRALQHVVINIFANAIEAMTDRPDPKITVRCQAGGDVVILTISDTGCGIREDIQGDIFKPFFTTKQDGTGLGLMLSRKLLSQMQCSMEISSKEGVGTTVTMLFPEAVSVDSVPAGVE